MKKRNLVPVILIASSITLLLVLQVLWLVNSYDDASTDLKRRTTDVFRSTLLTMRDSIFLKSIEADSLFTGGRGAVYFSRELDSVHGRRRQLHSMTELIVKGTTTDDSLLQFRRQSSNTAAFFGNGGRITVRFTPDTLSTDTIIHYFTKALAKENIDLPFAVKLNKFNLPVIDKDILPKKTIRMRTPIQPAEDLDKPGSVATEWVTYSPVVRYASVFDNVGPYLVMQIGPQILFSLALTLITSAAFFMMYRSMKSQQRLMEMKNDFISNITHELKTPVTTVSVALEALKNFKGLENPQTTREYLEIAQSELNRLSILTDKVLKTAVFDNRGVNFETEPVDLRKTIDQILHSMKLVFEKQKAHVTFEKQGDSFTINGGSVHLTNVIYNLLDNALKYSVNEPTISIHLEENDNQVIIKIADKGIGILPEYKRKIFEKFFRVPTGDIHNIKGYGLGLSYVDSVVRSHRGLIEVASKPGEGSVFTISLPKGF